MTQLRLNKPHLIVVIGIPGAGKTFFASQFADMFSAPHLDYSHYHYLIANRSDADELADYTFGQLLKAGQTMILEGHGETIVRRAELTKFARKNGYDVLFIWVQTDKDTAEHRATKSKSAVLTKEEFQNRTKVFEKPGEKERHMVISGKHTFSSQAKMVLKKLVAESGRPEPVVAPVHDQVTRFRGQILR